MGGTVGKQGRPKGQGGGGPDRVHVIFLGLFVFARGGQFLPVQAAQDVVPNIGTSQDGFISTIRTSIGYLQWFVVPSVRSYPLQPPHQSRLPGELVGSGSKKNSQQGHARGGPERRMLQGGLGILTKPILHARHKGPEIGAWWLGPRWSLKQIELGPWKRETANIRGSRCSRAGGGPGPPHRPTH